MAPSSPPELKLAILKDGYPRTNVVPVPPASAGRRPAVTRVVIVTLGRTKFVDALAVVARPSGTPGEMRGGGITKTQR